MLRALGWGLFVGGLLALVMAVVVPNPAPALLLGLVAELAAATAFEEAAR